MENNSEKKYSLIGLKSNIQDYKIAWNLNEILETDFVKINQKSDDFSYYSTFYKNKKIFLIENIIPGNLLFKDLKEFNFILKLFAEGNIANEIINKIKKSKKIDFLTQISKEKITKKTIKSLDEFYL